MKTRREFLKTTGAATAGLAACCVRGSTLIPSLPDAGSNGDGGPGESPDGGATPPQPGRILVVLNVDGGWDWLNVTPPVSGPNLAAYQAARPTLMIPRSKLSVKYLGNSSGLNADLTGLDVLHNAGKVAWIQGLGVPNPTLSHFSMIDVLGQGSATGVSSGWLGRFAETAFNANAALRAITVLPDTPKMLHGAKRDFTSIATSGGYVYPSFLDRPGRIGTPYLTQALEDDFAAACAATSSDSVSAGDYAAGATAGTEFLDATRAFGSDGTLPSRTSSVLYPGDPGYRVMQQDGNPLGGYLSYQLQLIAQMIAAGFPTQVFFARLSGWDTHSGQATNHPNLQRVLGGAIKAFYDDLATIPDDANGKVQDRVVIMTYSEFGRRIQENAGGTDHGTLGLAMVIGNRVNGGTYGTYPDLTRPDPNGNMDVTLGFTDYRAYYATILDGWLGQPPAVTDGLLGATYPRLGIF